MMIRAVLSSFLFLIPIYVSFLTRDTTGLFMFSIAMGMSIANYSHTFHINELRRTFFMQIDMVYMYLMSCYIMYESLFMYPFMMVLSSALFNYVIYFQLGYAPIEYYTRYQKKMHVVFHIVGVSTLTFFRYYHLLVNTNLRTGSLCV
jgi:hypothetical protein